MYDIESYRKQLNNEVNELKGVIKNKQENIDKLRALAETLLEKETLYEDEIDVILGLKSAEEVDLSKKLFTSDKSVEEESFGDFVEEEVEQISTDKEDEIVTEKEGSEV